MESTKITYNKELQINKQKDIQTADNISQICCLHVELIPRALKLWEEHKTLQNTVNNYIFQSWQQWTSIAFRGTSGLYPIYLIHIVIKDRWTIYTSTTLWWNPQSINRRVFGRPNSQGTTRATRPPWSQQRCGDVRIVLSGGSNFGDTNDAPIESRLKIRC